MEAQHVYLISAEKQAKKRKQMVLMWCVTHGIIILFVLYSALLKPSHSGINWVFILFTIFIAGVPFFWYKNLNANLKNSKVIISENEIDISVPPNLKTTIQLAEIQKTEITKKGLVLTNVFSFKKPVIIPVYFELEEIKEQIDKYIKIKG